MKQICLDISSWRDFSFVSKHFYGTLFPYGEPPRNREEIHVRCKMTVKQAEEFNKKDSWDGYEEGQKTNRFDSREVLITQAIFDAKEKWGVDIEIYLGVSCYLLEDMERIL